MGVGEVVQVFVAFIGCPVQSARNLCVTPPRTINGSPAVRVSAASTVLKFNVCPPASASTTSFSAAAWTISVRTTSLVPSVTGASSMTDTSVEAGAVGVDSTITGSSVIIGSSVVTGSSVGGRTTDVSSAGGVASSANTLIGKMSDNINENKMNTDTNVNFFMLFIRNISFPHPNQSQRPEWGDFIVL